MKKSDYDVFISYSRKDTPIVEKIIATFEREGISYFIDRQGIGGGMEFPAVLAKAIKQSNVFLFIASENSYASKFTQSEIVYAFNKKDKQQIIPYIIDGSSLPDELEFTFSAINWRNLEEHPIETVLVDDIMRKLGRTRHPEYADNSTTNQSLMLHQLPDNDDESKDGKVKFSGKRLSKIVLFSTLSISVIIWIICWLTKYSHAKEFAPVMNVFIGIALVLSFAATVVGFVRPKSVDLPDRGYVAKTYLVATLLSFMTVGIIGEWSSDSYSKNNIEKLEKLLNKEHLD